MSLEYLEVDSTYRNRNQYTNPANFVVRISQSGTSDRFTAQDPVSLAAPTDVWVPFGTLTGTYNYAAQNTGDTFVVLFPAGSASQVLDYYTGAVIRVIYNGTVALSRIRTWQYLETVAGNDWFLVKVFPANPSIALNTLAGVSFQIIDPTNFSDPSNYQVFIPISQSIENYYAHQIIFNETQNQYLTIVSYNHTTHMAQLAPSTYTWLVTDTLTLRTEAPVQYGFAIVASTTTTVQLDASSSAVDDYYVGYYIRVPSLNQSQRIVAYNGTTKVATVSPGFTVAPTGQYQLLQFSYDNEGLYTFSASTVSLREAVCYDIELLNLVVPNVYLSQAYGGHAVFYPYLYVQLTPENSSVKQGSNSIASNNPHAIRMLFRVLVDDTVNRDNSPFVRIDGGGMVQRIKLMPADSFRFAVYLPNGNLFQTVEQDNYSPEIPNSMVQISAMFSFRRVNTCL